MGSKERQLSYSIAFKIEVVNYAVKHGNWAVERHSDREDYTRMEEAKERFNQSRYNNRVHRSF